MFPGAAARTSLSSLTVRKKWFKELNIVVIECYYRLNPIDENSVPLKEAKNVQGMVSARNFW